MDFQRRSASRNRLLGNHYIKIKLANELFQRSTLMTAPKQTTVKFSAVKSVILKNTHDMSEAWVQQVLYDHPDLLGIGNNIVARDKERRQPKGRLDLLFEDNDDKTRYEVEVQLGATDETHIIRTIEYWDIERKRHPEYDHVAVIIAEDFTSRFFNVISLFNSVIPLIALKLTAIENPDGSIGLLFTRVLDLVRREVEENLAPEEQTDRNYWQKKVLRGIDQIVENIIQHVETKAQLSYNKLYCGIWVSGRPDNFVLFRPHKTSFYVDIRLDQASEIEGRLEKSPLDYNYLQKDGRYRLILTGPVDEDSLKLITDLIKQAHAE